MTHSIKTLNRKTQSIMTLGIMTLSKIKIKIQYSENNATLSIIESEHNDTLHKTHSIMLLCVMALSGLTHSIVTSHHYN